MIRFFEHWRDKLMACQGWRRAVVTFFFGALSVLALPPIHFVPVLLPSFVGLIWLLDGASMKAAESRRLFIRDRFFNGTFMTGWWFGLGFFVGGLYWIAFSFLVDAQQFAWMIPFAIFGLSGFFAIYSGCVSALAFRLAGPGPRRIIYFGLLWVGFEWVRGWAFTGFPWNLIGTVWTFNDAMIQVTSLIGVLGLSLATIAGAVSVSVLGYGDRSLRLRGCFVLVPFVLLSCIWLGGTIRLAGAEERYVENALLRLVQPNIAQKNKWKSNLRGKHLNNLLALSETPPKDSAGKTPTHIIWPETATPFFLEGNDAALRIISGIVPKGGALLTGSPRRTASKPGRPSQLWNSLHVVGADAKISATFDKFHLVPFGEYVPFRKYINIAKLTAGRTDFSSGPGLQSLIVPGLPLVSPLICYEVIFSGAATPRANDGQDRPGWLLNITNDAWFGTSSGPYQHLAAARLRAVEEGLPLIRVANTGISAVIDGYGRILKNTQLNERGIIDSPLPQAISKPTLFSRVGLSGFLALVLGFFLISRLKVLR